MRTTFAFLLLLSYLKYASAHMNMKKPATWNNAITSPLNKDGSKSVCSCGSGHLADSEVKAIHVKTRAWAMLVLRLLRR